MKGLIHELNEIRTLCEMLLAMRDKGVNGDECYKLMIEINKRMKMIVTELEKKYYEVD